MPSAANLIATPILDHQNAAIRDLAKQCKREHNSERRLLQAAHRLLVTSVKPVYSVNELQPASRTLLLRRGSCSQRMACLEAVSRASDIPTRSRALHVSGRFWYPRFRALRAFIPKKILLIWPQFFFETAWVDFDELYGSCAELSVTGEPFTNDGESIFDAVNHTAVDLMGKTCRAESAEGRFDLSQFVLSGAGFFDTRDEAFEKYGSFHTTLRGKMFEAIYGGRPSVSTACS